MLPWSHNPHLCFLASPQLQSYFLWMSSQWGMKHTLWAHSCSVSQFENSALTVPLITEKNHGLGRSWPLFMCEWGEEWAVQSLGISAGQTSAPLMLMHRSTFPWYLKCPPWSLIWTDTSAVLRSVPDFAKPADSPNALPTQALWKDWDNWLEECGLVGAWPWNGALSTEEQCGSLLWVVGARLFTEERHWKFALSLSDIRSRKGPCSWGNRVNRLKGLEEPVGLQRKEPEWLWKRHNQVVADIKTKLMTGFILGRLFPKQTLLSPYWLLNLGGCPAKQDSWLIMGWVKLSNTAVLQPRAQPCCTENTLFHLRFLPSWGFAASG